MNRLFTRVLFVHAVLALAPAGWTAPAPLPRPAPALKFKDLATGDDATLASLKGKVVIVDFWATWCEPCKREIPGYIAMQDKYGAQGLVVVGISLDQKGAGAIKRFAKDHGINYTIAKGSLDDLDLLTGEPGAEAMIPTTLLIDREGRIVHQKRGMMETAEYEPLVRKALGIP